MGQFYCQLYGPGGSVSIPIIATTYSAADAWAQDHAEALGDEWSKGIVTEVYP